MAYIVDTNVLLRMGQEEYTNDKVYIPMPVVEELDSLNHGKDINAAYLARKAIQRIASSDNFKVVYNTQGFKFQFNDFNIDETIKDNRILSIAYWIQKEKKKPALFITQDLALYLKAKEFGMDTKYVSNEIKSDVYKGYREVVMTESEMAQFYNDLTKPIGLLTNEYLALYDTENNLVDTLKWSGFSFVNLNCRKFKSKFLPPVGPIEDDFTQRFAFDSLYQKNITCLLGKAGSGKTCLSLSYMMQQLDNDKIKKAYIIYSFEPLRNNRTLGFLPGDKIEKILDSGLGTILSTKLGGLTVLRDLIANNKVEIIPTSDLRGIEFGSEDLVFMTEAQNTDPYTMRTLIQRCKDGCKIIIEGDMLEQVDIRSCTNGMEKLVEAFKGSECFSCVKLKKGHRNPISVLAENII